MATTLDDVLVQMRAQGLEPPPSVDLQRAFSRFLRFRPQGVKGTKKAAWVRLHEHTSRTTGQRFVSGAFGVWTGASNVSFAVEAGAQDWSPADRAAWLEARKAAERDAAAARRSEAEQAATKAGRMWERSRQIRPGPDGMGPSSAHPYLERKRVGAFGVRLGFNERLLVPLRDVRGGLQGLQYIGPDGAKLFGTGTQKEGCSHLIGQVDGDQAARGQPLAFGEGYATCASAHMATGWPVVVCFDAGNLLPVLREWRKLYPELPFVVLADDDRHLLPRLVDRLAQHGIVCTVDELREARGLQRTWAIPGGATVVLDAGWRADAQGVMRLEGTLGVQGEPKPLLIENAGQAKGHAAAAKCGARVFTPRFGSVDAPGTDWNDLHLAEGLEAVRGQLQALLEAPPDEKRRANARAPRARAGSGGDMPQRALRDGDMPFLERYTLVYGTTTVWDAQDRRLVRLEALKVAHGKLVDWWLQHDDRRMVSEDHVVFDPTGRCEAPEWVNLYDRLPLELPAPPGASCARIVEHLWNICGENDALCHWVTSWLALPLQQPGTKLRTALVLHGRTEGTGKSMLTDIMRGVYGRYGTSISQLQLQTEFTGWLSGKLFCVAEEVVSRQDRTHHKGLLQNLITNEVVQINEKNMPLRMERNHANFVFLSNEQMPMLLNTRDRRYTVIRVEQEHPEGYYTAIASEVANGGLQAFYEYLLGYDLQGFNAFTRPFENRDRMHLITLGMSPDQRFIQYWSSGLAGVPFCSCPAADLYTAFRAWGRLNGERFVPTATQFGRTVTEELERLKMPPKQKVRYLAWSEKQVSEGDWGQDPSARQGVVYFVTPRPEPGNGADDVAQAGAGPPGADAVRVPPPDADATASPVYNAKIKLFQAALHELLGSARRSL